MATLSKTAGKLAVLGLCAILPSAAVAKWNVRDECEPRVLSPKSAATSMSSPGQKYLRNLRFAKLENAIEPEDLQMASRSALPVNPMTARAAGRSPVLRSIKASLDRNVLEISLEDWPGIRAQMHDYFLSTRAEDPDAINRAVAAATAKARNSEPLLTSRGEVLINIQLYGSGGIYNLETGKFTAITPNRFSPDAALFEMANGQVLYAVVDDVGVQVFDARGGDLVHSHPFIYLPAFGRQALQFGHARYVPVFSTDRIHARLAIVPKNLNASTKKIPWAVLNLNSGEVENDTVAILNSDPQGELRARLGAGFESLYRSPPPPPLM